MSVAATDRISATATLKTGASSYADTSEFAMNVLATVSSLAPGVTAPGTASLNEDATRVFSVAGGNAVTVSDGTAGDGKVRVTLTVTQGTLSLAQTSGLSFVSGADGSATMVLDGLESAVNAALDGMVYTPDPDYHGAANLQVTNELAADLQGLYTFDAGTAADSSAGAANHGSFVGNAPRWWMARAAPS